LEAAPQLLARHSLRHQLFDRVQAGLDFVELDRWPQDPGAQQAFAHGSAGQVERAEQRSSRITSRQQGLDQFEVAGRDRIHYERALPLIKTDAVEVFERPGLRAADVVKDGAGCRGGRRLLSEAEAL